MNYATQYTAQFYSTDKVLWQVEIDTVGYVGASQEIRLEHDEPLVIEWQETSKTDVVQSSACTLRVSVTKDRMMIGLMTNRNALCKVYRNSQLYWTGLLDDSVYEEPYSFRQGYVTELTFSDFGFLNRVPFEMTGKQSVIAIVNDCLSSAQLGNLTVNEYVSLKDATGTYTIPLGFVYLNTEIFANKDDSWGDMVSKRKVLEDVLRPLGLRIMQKNGQIYIYDIEYLRDVIKDAVKVIWKGTDAYLKGGETYGRYEVDFDPSAEESISDGELDYDSDQWQNGQSYFATHYGYHTGHDTDIGFYVEIKNNLPVAPVNKSVNAKFFRTSSVLTDSSDIGVAWRIKCATRSYIFGVFAGFMDAQLVDNNPVIALGDVTTVFSILSSYLPLIPDRNDFQLRINLETLVSFRPNPLEDVSDDYKVQQNWWLNYEGRWKALHNFAILIPVKLELLDDNDQVIYHYENASSADVHAVVGSNDFYYCSVSPCDIDSGQWVAGNSSQYGKMFLAYYKNFDFEPGGSDRDPLVNRGWVGNRITPMSLWHPNGTLYSVRDDGEYIPLPPVAGRLRLTVGNGIFIYNPGNPLYYHFPIISDAEVYSIALNALGGLRWHLFRNPKMTIVKAGRRNDSINTDDVYERAIVNQISDASISEDVKFGCYRKGISPSALGLFFTAQGLVYERFLKNGVVRTLENHRLHSLEDQTYYNLPVLTGTAELTPDFCVHSEGSTPGRFVVTALRQDPKSDTEEVTMAKIANIGGFSYEYRWSDPVCVQEQHTYHYEYEWSNAVCVKKYINDSND